MALFKHRSPTGLIHGGELFAWKTICGTQIDPDSWNPADPGTDVTCARCRGKMVGIDMRGALDPTESTGYEPTTQQLVVFNLALQMYKDEGETVIGKLEPGGVLLLVLGYGDATTVFGRFGQDGVQIGAWF